ncbi:AbrB family transcriptional regulator [Umezawaea sp.]|uniref:AbrB family transcriptional regulator n=1 Tax=Umezawaea sp. TaxID=1955258 RepID=UPI002ED26D31
MFSRVAPRLLVAVVTALSAVLLTWLDVPAALLFSGVLGGLTASSTGRREPGPTRFAGTVAQAVLGASIGAMADRTVLGEVARHWQAILVVVTATLVVSTGVGQLLRLLPTVDGRTAVFSSVAGGAVGFITGAREAGADEHVVMVVQYLRVLLVLVSMPAVVLWLDPGSRAVGDQVSASAAKSALFALLAVTAGLVANRLLAFAGSALVWPMLAALGLAACGLFDHPAMPTAALGAAFLVVGLQIGSSLSLDKVRAVTRVLPLAGVQIVATVAACALVGVGLSRLTSISAYDAYLASTPGGLSAVLGLSLATESNTPLVMAFQVTRLVVSLLLLPLFATVGRRDG